jgi:hypothetical protein
LFRIARFALQELVYKKGHGKLAIVSRVLIQKNGVYDEEDSIENPHNWIYMLAK